MGKIERFLQSHEMARRTFIVCCIISAIILLSIIHANGEEYDDTGRFEATTKDCEVPDIGEVIVEQTQDKVTTWTVSEIKGYLEWFDAQIKAITEQKAHMEGILKKVEEAAGKVKLKPEDSVDM